LKTNRIPIPDICALAIYELINILFVYKYTSRITSYFWATPLLYLVIVNLFIILLLKHHEFGFSLKMQNLIYFSLIAIFAILLTTLMFHFDPPKIKVGRYPALYDWLTRIFNSEFPYASPIKPSGFPFLFVMVMPFFLLGDLGFFQIFSFIVFSVLVYLRHRQNSLNRFRLIFLLITAPMFLYEIVVRSDLFSNMVMVILYLAIFEILSREPNRPGLIILGIVGGLLLSTRGIVLLIYVAFFGYFWRRKIIRDGLFFISMFFGFLLTVVPFLIWDWRYFTNFGPFSIQLAHIPNWLLILSVASSIYCALTIRSLKRIYSSVSFILFGVTGVAFATMVFNCGWYKTVLGDGFDIGYFCFTLPFLLISLDFPEKETTSSPSGVFISGQSRLECAIISKETKIRS
jgi:hypothetical protein